MTSSRVPLHLGGPLGALGLGCFAGAVALAVTAINNRPDPPPIRPDSAGTVLAMDLESELSPSARPARPQEHPLPDIGGAGRPPQSEIVPVVELAQAQTAPPAQIAERPARAEGTEVHFIVRLKGAPEVDVITRNFKRDPVAAQTAWSELVARLPGLADFTLVGASYSGEIKLAYQMPPGAGTSPAEIRAVQERLLKVEGISYADPDYIAHPGKD